MIINGNKKSQLLGTAQDDIFYPSGRVYQEITLNPGNDTYNLGDTGWYDFYLTPVNYYTSTGARINLGTGTVILGGIALKPNTISDGYGGIDIINFTQDIKKYEISIFSGPYDDYLNCVGNTFLVNWYISPGQGNDTLSFNQNQSTIFLQGFSNLNINIPGSSGLIQLDVNTSINYSSAISTSWFIRGSGNRVVNNDPLNYISFIIDNSLNPGNQTLSTVAAAGISFTNFNDATIKIPEQPGLIQVDAITSFTYTLLKGGFINEWGVSVGNYRVEGSSFTDRIHFDLGATATVFGGGGADLFTINRNAVSVQINDYNFEDKLVFNILETNDKLTLAKSVTISQNKANYTTTLAFTASSVSTAANVVVNGWYSNYQFNSDGTVQLIPLLPNDPKNASLFSGNYLSTCSGGAGNNATLYLNNVQELLSFDTRSITTPDQVYYFDTGYDLITLWRTDNLLGGATSYRLIPTNFRSASGASAPTVPTEYVIYDTSTGNLYFDQDGTGPSPTVLAATFIDKPALKYTDFITSVPQTYNLVAVQEKVSEGQSATFTLTTTNVPAGTSVPYNLWGKGITAADVAGGQLTGNVVVDASGKATITIPIASDGVVEGAETLYIGIPGQSQTVIILGPVATFYGDGAQLKGTAGDDVFYPKGNIGSELTLSPGNDTYNLGSAASYQFTLATASFTAPTGAAINLSDKSIVLNGVALAPYTMADGFGSIDTFNFSNPTKNSLYFISGPNDDFLYATDLSPFWIIYPNSGRDTVSSVFAGLNFCIDSFTKSTIVIPGRAGTIQLDPTTALTYSCNSAAWNFYRGAYQVIGSKVSEAFSFWNDENSTAFKYQSVTGGGDADVFQINTGGIALRVLDFNVDDKLRPELLSQYGQATIDKYAIDKSISLSLNKTDYTTTVNFASTYFSSGSSYIVNGFYSSFSSNNGSVSLVPIAATDPNYTSYFAGSLVNVTTGAGSTNNQTLRLNDSGEVLSFGVQGISTADLVYNFESGKDLIHLWRTDSVLGGGAVYSLSAANFLAADGAKVPANATQYVIYDTSTGNLYFDQDGTGPSPTVLAVTMADKATLRYTDFKISTPQTYDVSAALASVDEGQSARFTIRSTNVLGGTTVSYTLSGKGISGADLAGTSLSGTVTLDATGSAIVVVPTTADNLIEGAETLQLSIQGKTASVLINDSSRPSAVNPANPVTYQLTPNFSNMLEGSLAEFTLRTNNLPPGAQVAYTVSGVPASLIDSTKLSGIAILDGNGSALIQVPILADGARAQGSQSVTLNVQNYSASIPISDSSPEMGNWSGNKIIEYINSGSLGSSGPQRTIYMASDPELLSIILNKSYPAVYYPKLMGFKSGVDLLHFVDDDVYANGNTGIEFLKLQNWLAGPGFTQPKSATDNVIYDTSTKMVYFDLDGTGPAPTTPVFQIADGAALSPADIQIQHPVLYTLNSQSTTNFLISANNYTSTTIPYTITGLTAADVVGGKLSGTVTLGADKTAVISVLLNANVVEKTITVNAAGLSASSTTGTTVVLTPTYAVAASASAVNEGSSATFLITTTNVTSGTALNFTLSGTGITVGDVVGGQLSGTALVNSSGVATVTVSLAADGLKEGPEVLVLTVAGKTASIVINDSGGTKSGTTGADSLLGSIGSDTIDGGAGLDTVFYGSNASAYMLSLAASTWTVSSFAEGVDTLSNIERLHFADQSLALDLGSTQSAGQAAMLLGAVLPGKLALDASKQALMGAVLGLFDQGYSLTVLAGALLRLDIWTILTGSNSNTSIANYLLTNVNGTPPTTAALNAAVSALTTEPVQGTWLAALAGGLAGQSHIGLAALAQTGLAYIAPEAITSSVQSINEGDTVSFTVTTNLPQGTSLSYALSGTGVTGADFTGGMLSGAATVGAFGIVSVSVGTVADSLTEGAETLVFTARGLSASVVINDTSVTATPTYAISPGAVSVNEGGSVTFTVNTTNVAAGTAVPYLLSGNGITASDLLGGQLSGTVAITQSGSAVISVPIAADLTTEGPETLVLTVAGKTAQVVINDTSVAAAATYALAASSSSVNEGSVATFTLSTTNVPSGTSVPYTLSGTGITAGDFVSMQLSGSVIVDLAGKAVISLPIAMDQSTEGPETLTLSALGATAQIVINDTSMAAATYQILPSALAVNGGETLVVTLKTTNLTAGTRVPYTLSVPALDIFGGALSGEFIVDANGSASVNIVTTQHQTTDILTINVFDQHQPVTLVGVKGG